MSIPLIVSLSDEVANAAMRLMVRYRTMVSLAGYIQAPPTPVTTTKFDHIWNNPSTVQFSSKQRDVRRLNFKWGQAPECAPARGAHFGDPPSGSLFCRACARSSIRHVHTKWSNVMPAVFNSLIRPVPHPAPHCPLPPFLRPCPHRLSSSPSLPACA